MFIEARLRNRPLGFCSHRKQTEEGRSQDGAARCSFGCPEKFRGFVVPKCPNICHNRYGDTGCCFYSKMTNFGFVGHLIVRMRLCLSLRANLKIQKTNVSLLIFF